MKHQGTVDKDGNFRDISRKKEGYFGVESKDLPFPALVTAWYPKSQTMDVIRPTEIGSIEYEGVVVYGNFFEETGTIQSPKLATLLKKDGYTTIRNEDQKDPDSSSYVLNTHIEALVFKTSVGYAAQSFRFLNPESPLLNNAKEGRKIVRHDDGSFYIHDDDGNIWFNHPSGLNIRAGNDADDLDLEETFPPHEKNVQDYADDITIDITIPNSDGDHKLISDSTGIHLTHKEGGQIGYDNANKLLFSNIEGEVKTDVLDAILDHETATLEFLDDSLDIFILHNHPCIVPTGTPVNSAAAVALRVDVQLEISAVSTTKTTLGTIMS